VRIAGALSTAAKTGEAARRTRLTALLKLALCSAVQKKSAPTSQIPSTHLISSEEEKNEERPHHSELSLTTTTTRSSSIQQSLSDVAATQCRACSPPDSDAVQNALLTLRTRKKFATKPREEEIYLALENIGPTAVHNSLLVL
jgi:hypothetical protein